MNYIQAWLYIIGTPERAKKLGKLLDRLPGATTAKDDYLGTEIVIAPMCPTQVLFGAKESGKLYANSELRPALDAWDNESLTRTDLRRFCSWITSGKYQGSAYTQKRSNAKA